ncbi:hypothetical protein [Staphylococcus carnosus]|uniref:hypothetical protein n=1 Tax=Staphylococcus carnosus TaxID=1281 RepID=UPI000AE301EC|nr:hypothetical protein [Staphylococcus carnosus]
MQRITNYIQEDDGTITAVIKNVTLGNKETLLLDNGMEVEVDDRLNKMLKGESK